MIQKYKTVSIIYGGTGKKYAAEFSDKIHVLAEKERYPISAKMIMERILTQELLSGVMNLFRESEICITFLTADDCCIKENGQYKRLRQNIVFELGMAIFHLGREHCILLSDFDIHDPFFELPSDMNSLEIKQFDPDRFSEEMDDVISKILQLSKNSACVNGMADEIPQYNNLLTRDDYYVDYENIFNGRYNVKCTEGSTFLKENLRIWLEECESLPHYDERCIYLLERIGFLPMFGKIPEAQQWLLMAAKLLENYKKSDIAYYGNTQLLDFIGGLIGNIIEYTKIKMKDIKVDFERYKRLLDDFLFEQIPEDGKINPLLVVIYYDYLGLIYLKLFQCSGKDTYARQAQNAFCEALKYVGKVDMALQIWSGFLSYNLARAYAMQGSTDLASEYYRRTIRIRTRWLKNSQYNITIRNALSSEYFIAKIDYIDMCGKFGLYTESRMLQDYHNLEIELDTYCDVDDKLEQLLYIRKLLETRIGK